MYQQWSSWKMKSCLLPCMFGCICVRLAARQSECHCVCMCLRETERGSGGRGGSLSPRESVKNSPGRCPLKRFMNLSMGCVCEQLCVCMHTKGASGPLWACLSCPSEIGFHYGVNEPIKLIAINWRPHGLPMERGGLSTGSKSTNNILTHNAIWHLNENNLPNSVC